MIDHRSFATDGLYPGSVSTYSIALLGSFITEVIIEPVIPQSTGGGGYLPLGRVSNKYIIRIRIKRGSKVWEIAHEVNEYTAKVTAKFLGIKLPEIPNFAINSITETVKEPVLVKVFKK